MNLFSFLLVSTLAGWTTWCNDASAETLEDVLGASLLANPQVKSSLSKWKVKQKAVDAAKSGFWPSLDVEAGIGLQKKDTPADNEDDNVLTTRKEASISFRQSLFSGFSTLNDVMEAKKSSEAEQWMLLSTLEGLALKIISAYFDVLENSEILEMSQDNLEIHNKMLKDLEKKMSYGLIKKSDILTVRGRIARAKANLASSKNNMQDALSVYQSLTGSEPKDLTYPSHANLQLPDDIKTAVSSAMKNNPEIKAANLSIESAEHTYSSLRSSYLPTIDATIKRSWKNDVDGQKGSYLDSTAIINVKYNIFSGGLDKSKVQESAYKTEETRSSRDSTARDVEERLQLAWASLIFSGAQKKYLLMHEKINREIVEADTEQFGIGKKSILDMLENENELFRSSISLTNVIYQEAYDRYRVLEATGQLFSNLKITIPYDWKMDP